MREPIRIKNTDPTLRDEIAELLKGYKHYKLGMKMMHLTALVEVALGLVDEEKQFSH
ncbi:MAG: hypothetical protein M0Z35_11285 [Desulfitobacterium hafniense]|nr:hypothetical protein [Desulfitobacterium hafniense]